jgi:hypothetical protein
MSLKDLKNAAALRQQETDQVSAAAKPEAPSEAALVAMANVSDGRTKMLGARVPLLVHREWQGHLYRAQEMQPDLTTQGAMPALIRLLRDETVWQKFIAELDRSH